MKKAKVHFSAMETAETPHDFPFDGEGNPKILITIDGLEVSHTHSTGDKTVFELSGVKRRKVDWPAVFEALGYTEQERMDDDLCEEVGMKVEKVVMDIDIRNMLRERLKVL